MELSELCDIMVDTLQEALNSFYLVAFLFGFGILRYPWHCPRVSLSILYILSVWSIYAYFLYYVAFNFLNRTRSWHFLIYFMIIINLLVTLITIIITICEHKKFNVLINQLNQVDDTLEEFGTPKEYRKMQSSIKWIIIIWFIHICIFFTIHTLCNIEVYNDTKASVIPIITDFPYLINILTDMMVMFILRYIGTRYDKINYYIRVLSETEEYGLRCMWKKSSLVTHYCTIMNHKRILWTTMHLHSQLRRIALDIYSLFDIQMTLQIMCYFVTLISMFYYQYYRILYLMCNGSTISWRCFVRGNMSCVLDIIRIISLNYICESVSTKAQKTENIIHKLTNLIRFDKAREEISQFVLQISLQPLKFSGMGLFNFGHKFLYKFFAWMISVIILVIQMGTSSLYQVMSRENVTCQIKILE